jgi:ketosteroid isomerase-like protein
MRAGEVRGRRWGAAGGVEVEMQEAYIHRLRDGKIVQVDEHTDRRGALEAAGLPG